jgi:hypothetical protein
MLVQLSAEQQDALAQCAAGLVKVVDPSTNATYVLVPSEVYERFRAVFESSDFEVREAYPLMEEVARREGWDDPAEDIYNDLDPRRPE